MDVQLVGIIGELAHLSKAGVGLTLCGVAVTAAWGVKRYLWIGQVGCKKCREELGKNTKSPYEK